MRDDVFYSRPMVIGALLLNLGGFAYLALRVNRIVMYGIIISVLVAILFLCSFKKGLVLIAIFGLGFLNIYTYYEVLKPYDIYDRGVLTRNEGSWGEMTVRGKMIYISGEIPTEIGKEYALMGDFKEEPNFQRGILGTMKIYRYTEEGNTLLRYVYKAKDSIDKKAKEVLSKRAYGYFKGMCLGSRDDISEDEIQRIKNLGLMHILAVSGMHMMILLGACSKVIGRRRWILILLIVYVMIVGSPPSALRALIMICISTAAVAFCRTYDKLSAVAFTSILILLIQPQSLYMASYHLSFLAVCGIILFLHEVKKVMMFLPDFISTPLALLLTAQVFTLPYFIFVFQELNIGIFLGGIFVIPIATIMVIGGFFLLPLLYTPLVADLTGSLYNLLAEIFYGVSFVLDKCSLKVLKVEGNYAILYLLVLAFLLYGIYREKNREDEMNSHIQERFLE